MMLAALFFWLDFALLPNRLNSEVEEQGSPTSIPAPGKEPSPTFLKANWELTVLRQGCDSRERIAILPIGTTAFRTSDYRFVFFDRPEYLPCRSFAEITGEIGIDCLRLRSRVSPSLTITAYTG